MPMLERTAAGLEPSGLQRLLPRAAKGAEKSSRVLAAPFRQQAAPEVDLSQAYHSLVASGSLRGGYFDMFTPDLARTEPMNASTFLLDFLYPKAALAFIRKLSMGATDRHNRLVDSRGALTHRYRRPARQYSSFLHSSSTSASPCKRPEASISSAAPTDSSSPTTPDRKISRLDERKDAFNATSASAIRPPHVEQAVVLKELEGLLRLERQSRDLDTFDQVWRLYNRLETGRERSEIGRAVLLFITPSWRYTEAHRTLRLFDEIDSTQWDAAIVSSVIKAHLTLKNRTEALSIFEKSLAMNTCAASATAGFDLLVANALKTSSWELISEVWAVYREKTGRSKADELQLKAVLDLSTLREKLQLFSEYVHGGTRQSEEEAKINQDQNRGALKDLYKSILEASLHRLDSVDTFPFVQRLKNPRVYENFIQIAINNKHADLAAQAYAKYRLLPGYQPRSTTLMNLVRDVFYPQDVRGMEDVLKDWYSLRGHLNHWGYQKYLAFYASRGDVTSVYRLWNEFTEAYPSAIRDGEDTFAHLLKVHAVRGDLAQVEQVFSEIHDKYNVEPNTICWNIRLHIYVERGHYAKAMKVFEDLCEAVQPDDYSFGTIMAIVGGRGDLALVSDLYWLAQQCGVRITESIIDPIVEAYCQNDCYDEAERLCVTTTREAKVVGRPYTALWNTLLQHHALRHDLVAVNRILKVMTRLHVTYDEGTYSALLFALAQCRQPRRAVELLRTAQEDGIFRPTAYHYTLLMMAYIRSKQPHRALQVNRLMHHMGFQRSSQQIQMVIKAFSQWQDYPKGDKADVNGSGGASATERRDLFAKALREFQRSLVVPDKEPTLQTRAQTVGREVTRMHLGAVRRFSFVIFMLVQARDFAGVEEVMQLYQSIAPADEQQQPLPLKLCNALMLSDYYEGRFDQVKEMWQKVLERTKEISRPQALKDTRLESILGHFQEEGSSTEKSNARQNPEIRPGHDPKVVAKLRYGLTDPLKTMQRLYAAERNADGLVQLINDDILTNGFLLDSKNWNHYVQNLARLGRTREAFAVCEKRLMAQWSGFAVLRARHRRWAVDGSDQTAAHTFDGTGILATRSGDLSSGKNSAAPDSDPNYKAPSTNPSARLSRAQQLRESATRYNRPMTYTFMVLAKAYLELEQMAPWSSVAERQFNDLAVQCPKSVHAVRTMVRMNSRIEGRVFGGGDGVASDLGVLPLLGGNPIYRHSVSSTPSETPSRQEASL